MSSREGKDTAIQHEGRVQRSKDVVIQFIDESMFNVMDGTKIKYLGKISEDKQSDDCTCQSFTYGQRYDEMEDGSKGESRYEAENGHRYQCKHIIKARSLRYKEEI